MPQARCLIKLNGTHITQELFTCTGAQLSQLLNVIKAETKDCFWFVSDADSYEQLPDTLVVARGSYPALVGDTDVLIREVQDVDQFLSGVFLAIPTNLLPVFWSRIYLTEDQTFQDMGNARFEIRAFDTSYFEIYAPSEEFLLSLSKQFHIQPTCM